MKHPIATPTGTVIDLAPFCGQNDVRSYLNAPFSVQGGTGACDGHALVWVDTNIQAPALSAAAEGNIAAVVDARVPKATSGFRPNLSARLPASARSAMAPAGYKSLSAKTATARVPFTMDSTNTSARNATAMGTRIGLDVATNAPSAAAPAPVESGLHRSEMNAGRFHRT